MFSSHVDLFCVFSRVTLQFTSPIATKTNRAFWCTAMSPNVAKGSCFKDTRLDFQSQIVKFVEAEINILSDELHVCHFSD